MAGSANCGACDDRGHVCENHPGKPWGPLCCDQPATVVLCEHGACHCGAGEPCPACSPPGQFSALASSPAAA